MQNCPTCNQPGRKVKRITLESVLRPERRGGIGEVQYHVCITRECETVYFGTGENDAFVKSDLSLRFGLKEKDAPRAICYCFDHSVEEIHDEIRRTGRSTVLENIKADMKGLGCRCERTNPLGGCCLKTVQDAVEEGFELAGCDDATERCADHADCCGTGDEPSAAASGRSGAIAAGGSVLAAVLSSACCWLPLVLIAFGVSAAGVAGFFEAYRPYFLVGAVVMLGFGFYFVYFRQEKCAPESACAAPNRRMRTFSRGMLWAAAGLVGAFASFPNYVGYLFAAPTSERISTSAHSASAEFRIGGMTCEGCSHILRTALAKVPNVASVDVDYSSKTAVVRFDPGSPVSIEQVIATVKGAGYTARFVGDQGR